MRKRFHSEYQDNRGFTVVDNSEEVVYITGGGFAFLIPKYFPSEPQARRPERGNRSWENNSYCSRN